jgi:dsRNA-specific ribonuclease
MLLILSHFNRSTQGTGVASSKAAAKEEAARQALNLMVGVIF